MCLSAQSHSSVTCLHHLGGGQEQQTGAKSHLSEQRGWQSELKSLTLKLTGNTQTTQALFFIVFLPWAPPGFTGQSINHRVLEIQS